MKKKSLLLTVEFPSLLLLCGSNHPHRLLRDPKETAEGPRPVHSRRNLLVLQGLEPAMHDRSRAGNDPFLPRIHHDLHRQLGRQRGGQHLSGVLVCRHAAVLPDLLGAQLLLAV